MSTLPDFMHVADNLTDAAVALESTVISHGLPYPHNIQLAPAPGGDRPRSRRDPGHHRHHRRPDRRRAGPRPDRAPGDGAGRPQGEPPRSADRGGAQAGRRDHRRDHFVGRAPGRHPGLRHGRDRGSASDETDERRRTNDGIPAFILHPFILHPSCPPTSQPISPSSRKRPSSSSARGRRRSWICRRRWNGWRRTG